MSIEMLTWREGIVNATSRARIEAPAPGGSTSTPAAYQHYLLGPLADGYRLIKPLLVKIEPGDDGDCLVSDDLFGVYGSGNSESKALADYRLSLVEYFDLVAARAGTNEANRALFSTLESFVQAAD
jgi:hypothetical protein